MTRLWIACVAVAVGAVGCATGRAPPAQTPNGLLVSVERSACEEGCPVYKVDVDLDGTVRYEGRACVRTVGRVMAELAPEKMEAIRKAIARADFASLAARCCVCEFDNDPTVTITVAEPAPARTIENACGTTGRAGMVAALANEIDALVEIERWVGRAETPVSCPR